MSNGRSNLGDLLYTLHNDKMMTVRKEERAMEEKKKASRGERWQHFKEHFYDAGDPEQLSPYKLFLMLFLGSLIGSLIEVLYCRFSNGYWENRTSLVYGPFSLAEGFGALILTIFLHKDAHKPVWKVFLKAFFWMSIAEYVMSWGQEFVFGTTAWNYSNMPLNINGRICLYYSLFWGALGVLWAKVIYPVSDRLVAKIPKKVGKVLFWILFVFFVYDCIISCFASARFNSRRAGEPPKNQFDVLMDKQFPDSYMRWVYANTMDVKADGSHGRTMSGKAEKYGQKHRKEMFHPQKSLIVFMMPSSSVS